MPSQVKSRRALTACMVPVFIFFAAFWLLPVTQLIVLPARNGWETYFAILTDSRYASSLVNTLLLSIVVTVTTLALGLAVGLYLAKPQVIGRRFLLSLLTLPLSFPGVVVGFFIILLGGRQGAVADLFESIGLGRITFAYGLMGLFLAYLYFSLPRVVASYTAAAQSMDQSIEEAARSLGASRFQLLLDVWLPQLMPTTLASAGIVFATSMGAFGTAFTLASKFEVLPITIYNEFTNYANFPLAAALSLSLGFFTWLSLFLVRRLTGGRLSL
ncbi:ABC transporter permease [Zwartia panacis]|uniref:ABC transporter permease n=1 Tax=Zwartia panacis TaxID=2683345 RepID=UPI0025B496BB|nr:ABC transporter permease [Zwartia panacis]MDN4016477.1 ABC transporter permease [Zwartia panacis]